MGRQNASAAFKVPLSLADGNRRKSSRTRPTQSQKEKENIAQQQDGFTIPDDESVEEMVNGMDTTEDTENGRAPQWFRMYVETQISKQQQYDELVRMIAFPPHSGLFLHSLRQP